MAANPKTWPVMVGEGSCQYLGLWSDVLKVHPDFQTISLPNPPGAAAAALRVAVRLLQGGQLDPARLLGQAKTQIVFPLPQAVTKDTLQQVYAAQCQGRPASYLLDEVLRETDIDPYFLK
jgi:ribose transport system substrate-binding protein